MSTITTINASDQITNSRSVINTNFSNLNTDKIETSVIDTDTTLAANSDSKIPSQKAVKAYIDAAGSIDTGLTQSINAGETINGATLPIPVYISDADGEAYACDGNDTSKMKFIGFAVSNGTNGNPMDVQFSGIVDGFTGLTAGEKYYLQDTAGTIGTTKGTYEVLVGFAISTTQILIMKGKRRMSGVTTFTASGNTAITLGFRPSSVKIYAVGAQATNGLNLMSQGGWTADGGDDCVYVGDNGGPGFDGGTAATYAWNIVADNTPDVSHRGTITSVTDTGFTLSNTKTNGPPTVSIYWEAEGEL